MKKHSVLLSLCAALTLAMLGCGGTSSLRSVNDPPPPDPPGGNSALHGDYALSFSGLTGNTSISVGVAYVGRFTADGAGNLTNGELDTNSDAAGHVLTAQSFAGNYSIGSDNRGFMTLNVGGKSLSLAIALTASGNAQFIELDASGGSGVIGSGTIEKADTSAYSTAEITGDYAFGAAGFDNGTSRSAIEGRFTSNGAGTLTNAAGDLNASGTVSSMTFTSANYTVSDNATGRGTMQMNFTHGGTADTLNFIFYVVNAGKLFVMETGAVSPTTPLLNGQVLRQQVPGGGFSNSSLNGNMVIALTGRSTCSGGSRVPKTVAGLLNTDGTGALSLTYDENFCSAPNSVTGATGTYTVASDGRAAMTIGSNNLVAYLVNSNQMFLFVSDANVLFGTGEPQTGGPLTNSSLKGGYAGFTTDPMAFGVNVFSGEFSADGASPTGNLTGTEDTGGASGPVTGASFAATYSVTSSPTNGRGTVALKSPSGGNAVAYMVSPTKFIVVPLSDPTPALWVFESSTASTPPPVTLASLALNPTSVTGGSQNSTGTVTLSAAAPSGGAQVTLSSSNTSAAQTPASITVASGSTTATFTVTTSAVSAATTVTISASYSGTTNTATLTVNPAAPPPVTLTSLSLSPTSVTGGSQNSTGTVTLSGAAPSGGAQVTLSSSNTAAAQTPASVTVASGSTTATFTVTTSAVSAATTATISAAFAGTTKTATLTVNPAAPPPVTLSSVSLSPTNVTGGSQNSTGTVTLSGAAPSGGAQVTLSSSNTSAAQTPSSVTVASGSTTATFTVTTSSVSSSTTVTISASFSGTTKSATLKVNPPPPPPVTLVSLTLNPTTVVGGVQSASGTVTLSGPAPSGGAKVSLSSSSGAASVPSFVIVPAGATSASFTVNTSIVLITTSAVISATYNGDTQTASLSVLI